MKTIHEAFDRVANCMRACAYAGVAIPAEVWHAYVDVTRMLAGDFKEEDHPRSDDGKFGSGGGAKDESGPGKGTTHKDFRDSKVVAPALQTCDFSAKVHF